MPNHLTAKEMNEGQNSGQGLLSIMIVFITWLFNIGAMVTKENVSFGMGLIVSLLAIIHYVTSIRKNTKKS